MPPSLQLLGRRSRSAALALVALCAPSAASCAIDGPYVRDNPFDIGADVVITIIAPDSVHVSNERFVATVASESPLPPEPLGISWESSNSGLLLALGGGAYRTGNLSPQYLPVQILAYFGDRVVSKTVYVGRRP
jgi:hypothetical protein